MNKEQKIEMIIERYQKMTPEQKRKLEKLLAEVNTKFNLIKNYGK